MFNLKKIFQLPAGTSIQDGHEIPVSEGVDTGKVKKYTIGQLKAFISAFVLNQISGITKGDQGPQGVPGTQGIQGVQGVQGLKGDKGDQGLKGDTGTQGPIGIQGPIGLKGDKGDTGTQGVQGIKGDKGDQGDQGLKGDGIAAGGTIGQLLAKTSNDDFETEWVDPPSSKLFKLQSNPYGLTEVSFLLKVAGKINSVDIDGANTPKLKIGLAGTYPVDAQEYPFEYDAGDRIFITFNYDDQFYASCNIVLNCEDN